MALGLPIPPHFVSPGIAITGSVWSLLAGYLTRRAAASPYDYGNVQFTCDNVLSRWVQLRSDFLHNYQGNQPGGPDSRRIGVFNAAMSRIFFPVQENAEVMSDILVEIQKSVGSLENTVCSIFGMFHEHGIRISIHHDCLRSISQTNLKIVEILELWRGHFGEGASSDTSDSV